MVEDSFPKKVQLGFSVLLLLTGIALYLVWGINYSSWNFIEAKFIGLYALVVPLVLFGVLGILFSRLKK